MFDWFVDIALERAKRDIQPGSVDQLISRLKTYAESNRPGDQEETPDIQGAWSALQAAIRVDPTTLSEKQSEQLLRLATKITVDLVNQRIRPDATQTTFV